jgi:uncharacterized protein YajQ (UPF0234 family)
MPSFDVVSEVDNQEVRNAVDQAQREITTRSTSRTRTRRSSRTGSCSPCDAQRGPAHALRQVVEEKLVKRGVSLKGVDYGDVEEATQNTVRQSSRSRSASPPTRHARSTSS